MTAKLAESIHPIEKVLVLTLEEPFDIPVNIGELTLRVHHKIDYHCDMLGLEMLATKILLVLYLLVLSLWFYRNIVHYPNTMTVLHRLMSIPPVAKFILIFANYLMYSFCPWKNVSIKNYIILVKVLLTLVFESVLIGTFFLIAMGYKIARSNISLRNFGIMITAMLSNYLVVFIFLVFNEFYSIGTLLYNMLNISFFIFVYISGGTIVSKLRYMQQIAANFQYPQRAISVKISLMSRSVILICLFFLLEVFYHGVLYCLGVPSTLKESQGFFVIHESTDFLILASLMFILKTQEYIPYYGVINLDDNSSDTEELEMQRINEVETLNFEVSSHRYLYFVINSLAKTLVMIKSIF